MCRVGSRVWGWTSGFGPVSVPAPADAWIVHDDGPQWRDLTAAEFSGCLEKAVVDGRRIQRREAIEGVEQGAPHACRLASQE